MSRTPIFLQPALRDNSIVFIHTGRVDKMGFFWCNEEEVKSLANRLRGILFISRNRIKCMEIRYAVPETWLFLLSLSESTLAKYMRVAKMLEEHGHEIGMPYSKPIGQGLFELRVRGILEVRAIYEFVDQSAVVLHAFVKKSEKIPRRDLKLALRRRGILESK